MKRMLFTLSLALLCAAVVGQMSLCPGSFESGDGNWRAEWSLTSDYLYVDFTVRAVTDGWLGIGFSADQIMPQTDMIIGAINAAGTEYSITDRYAEMRMPAPAIDDYQNITNLRMERVTEGGQTYQVMYFRRPVCSDNEDDMALSLQPYLLYAWGNINNDDVDDILGHMSSTRGPSSVRYDFLCDVNQGSFEDTAAGIPWVITWEVPLDDTTQATFQLVAQAMGWIAIGFSRNTVMPNTDIIVGAANGTNMSYVSDRYASGNTAPSVDAYQNITYEAADRIEMGGNMYTRVNFTRPTAAADDQDIALDDGAIYLLVAWGDERNFNGSDPMSIMQHTPEGRAVLPGTYTFFTCGVIAEPDNIAEITTAAPTATDVAPGGSAVVSVTTTLMLILAFIAVVNI